MSRPRGSSSRWVAATCVLLALAAAWTVFDFVRRPGGVDAATNRPIEVCDEGYASSNACKSCHPQNYDTWHASYHRRMTQVATPDAVIGDFDGATAFANGRRYFLERRGDEFWVKMKDPDHVGDERALPWMERRIVLTTGSHHMQVYWYETDQGRTLGQLPVVYLNEEKRWVPRTDIFLQPAAGHISSETGRWNKTCIKCHTTHGRPRLDEDATPETFDTHVAQFGISCEECHGPAEEHVRANRDPLRRYRLHFGGGGDSTVTEPRRLPGAVSSQVCGQCHGILLDLTEEGQREYYVGHGFEYVPGEDLEDSRVVARPARIDVIPALQKAVADDPSYLGRSFWSDGMVRVSGREYNGLVESPCFAGEEFACMSCHSMHRTADDTRPVEEWANDQLKPAMDGDLACIQCHDDFADVAAHTHHPASSSGSRCMNCHMPYTTYGLLKAIRSHQVSSPDVSVSVATGRPNACNQCHLDRTMAWSAEHLEKWYGIAPPALDADEASIAASVLWLTRGDAGQRALMAWSYGWDAAQEASGRDWQAPYLAGLLDDSYATVRHIAARSLRRFDGFQGFQYDYVGDPQHRREAAGHAFRTWAGSRRAGAARGRDTVLMTAAGLRADEVERLLRERTDPVVILAE